EARVSGDVGMRAKEAAVREAFDAWWSKARGRVGRLPETKDLMKLRGELMGSFGKALDPVGVLDGLKVAGVVATFWGESLPDLKTLMARGFQGVVEGWVTTITSALEDEEGKKENPLDHDLVAMLVPDHVREIVEAEARVAELNALIKAAEPSE